ncbi:MAG: hypothetical protein AAF597_05115, partial [Bacteroidota bacterium]
TLDHQSSYETSRFFIDVMPLSTISVYPKYRMGVGVIRNKLIFSLDVEYGNEDLFTRYDAGETYRFIGLRPQFRWREYFDDHSFYYVGTEFSINTLRQSESDGTFMSTAGSRLTFDSGDKERQRLSGQIRAGLFLGLGPHFFFDLYTGIGAAVRKYSYVNLTNLRLATEEEDQGWGFSSDNSDEGVRWVLDLGLGFKVGYIF